MQDTGFSEFLPCGEGLFAFHTEDDVVAAVDAIKLDYERHCRAARAVAERDFNSDKLLGDALRQCGLPSGALSFISPSSCAAKSINAKPSRRVRRARTSK